MAQSVSAERGCPLQLVQLDMENKKVLVDEESLGMFQKELTKIGAKKVAVVAVMGAFRTGKSFLLDLFLRYLRHEASEGEDLEPAPRGSGADYVLPKWMVASGQVIEGASDDHVDGFRFKGGMDACTEGIWVWSKPFVRKIQGEEVALILMDTQGAWDSQMTKEQSATIFGLTAVLSSKQIYNINMQIQEDKVENLAYFMQFAQAAIRKEAENLIANGTNIDRSDLSRPFLALDFLVRDWRNFREKWTVEECKEQMNQHLAQHMSPTKVAQSSTVEALNDMFKQITCFCLPHPGLAVQGETWSGDISDISIDFMRFIDIYVREVFTTGLMPKSILGSDLSTRTFPYILRDFVKAFHSTSPVAMTFTEAMTNCTVLLAKESAMKSYTEKMNEMAGQSSRGVDVAKFKEKSMQIIKDTESTFKGTTIFGSDEVRSNTWVEIQESLDVLYARYAQDNQQRLEKALVSYANYALLGLLLFALDRISDLSCDWWSKTCVDLSKCMLMAQILIFGYIGVCVCLLIADRGKLATAVAGTELSKEMVRLSFVYCEMLQKLQLKEVYSLIMSGKGMNPPPGNNKKEN